jgi:hypothetical protein
MKTSGQDVEWVQVSGERFSSENFQVAFAQKNKVHYQVTS